MHLFLQARVRRNRHGGQGVSTETSSHEEGDRPQERQAQPLQRAQILLHK